MNAPAAADADFLLSLLADRPRVGSSVCWSEVVRLLRLHGLEGLAFAAHRKRELLPPDVAARLEPAYARTFLHTTLVVESARRARTALLDAGIPSLLLKGAALVEDGTYPDPGARRMSDADLLVPAAAADRAMRRLEAAGFRPWSPWRAETAGWLDSATLHDPEAPAGLEVSVDLHWRIRYDAFRLGEAGEEGPLGEDADAARGIPAAGAHFLLLSEHFLKHLRVHAHVPALGDLARVSRRVDAWEPVLARARARRSARALGVLYELLETRLGAPLPPEAAALAGRGPARSFGRRALRPGRLLAGGTPAGGRLRGLLFRWTLAGSAGAALAEFIRTALPGAAWLRARYPDAGGSLLRLRARYWVDLLRWGAGRGPSPVSPNQEFE